MSWTLRRDGPVRAGRATLGSLVAAGLATATLLVAPAAAGAAPGGWAALGDSYTSGPLIPNQTLSPLGCWRSDHNYPHLAAAASGLALTDLSCSGASIADLSAPQATSMGTNRPQLSAVNSADRVVTLGIGGNDIDFTGILENCAALTPWGPTAVGLTCSSYYDAHGVDRIGNAIQALLPEVEAAVAEIRSLAPSAHVLLVGYPAILPATGSGCWPQVPFTTTDVPYLRAKEVQLDGMLATAATAANSPSVRYVNTYTPSLSHNACTAESTRWVEPLVPATAAFPFHPNAAGEAGMARIVEAAVAGAGI